MRGSGKASAGVLACRMSARIYTLQARARRDVRTQARWAPLQSVCRGARESMGLARALGVAAELMEHVVTFLPYLRRGAGEFDKLTDTDTCTEKAKPFLI